MCLPASLHRQYVITSDITLSRQIKHLLAKLVATSPPSSLPEASLSPEEQVTAEVRLLMALLICVPFVPDWRT